MNRMHYASLIILLFLNSLSLLSHEYPQHGTIAVYADNDNAQRLVDKVLTKFNIHYHTTQTLNPLDEDTVYIVAGNLTALDTSMMPKNYILYSTDPSSKKNVELLSSAIAIWDTSWDSINQYKNQAPHYYFLPDEHYDYLDPVLLPCFLPKEALSTYHELLAYSNTVNTDFSSHVPSLFCHCMFQNPSIIVDSGVRGGEGSTVPLNAVSLALSADMIGLDIVNCINVYSKLNNPRAHFVHIDDVQFPHYFSNMQRKKDTVDFIFIDTSHQYQHTLQEIKAFVPMLSENGILGFHDSNVTPLNNNGGYVRINNTATNDIYGNPRGVTQAIKEYFNIAFNEYQFFTGLVEKDGFLWRIVHYPFCNGLTITKKIKALC